jgi:hypothetical protein
MHFLIRYPLAFLSLGAALLLRTEAGAATIKLTRVPTAFNNPIGIDYHEPTGSLVMSVNYPTGLPHNFERVEPNGAHVQFSSASGFTEEVKIATVRSGNVGGFTTGDLFTGNGVDGQIARITNGGVTVISPWADLPGPNNGLMRGSLYSDRTGVYGGDLIAVTTGGEVWRINSAGVPTMISDVNVHLEGLITVPNNPAQYGPLAGKIIAGAEGQGRLYAFDNDGLDAFYNLGVAIEDIDLINAGENFFGVNFGTGFILTADAADFAPLVGEILLTQETHGADSGLYRLFWDGVALQTELISLTADSAPVGQWEHVTFAPVEVVPEAATLLLLGTGLAGAAFLRRKR